MTSPLETPDAYDVAYLGGQPTPGLALVSGFVELYDWDVKKSKGSAGATITAQGRPPCDSGSIKLQLWLPEHFAAWDAFKDLLRGTQGKGKTPAALSIEHPHANDVGVTSVVVKKITQITPEGGQLYSVTIDVLEYRKPVKAGGTPTAARTQYVDGNKPATTAQDVQDRELQELLKKAAAA
jgi:hypothetical protein